MTGAAGSPARGAYVAGGGLGGAGLVGGRLGGAGLARRTLRGAGAALAASAVLAAMAAILAVPLGGVGRAGARAPEGPRVGPRLGPRAAMILLDINKSMASTGIPQERGAALDYASALPADVRVGLITFSNTWRVTLRPTTNRARLAAALEATHAAGNSSTGLLRAVSGAESVLNAQGAAASRRLLVLSDGRRLTAAGPAPTIPTDVVTWYYANENNNTAALRALATASGGRVTDPLGTAPLAAAFPAATTTPEPARSTPASAVSTPASTASASTTARTHQPGRVASARPGAHQGGAGARVRWSWLLIVLVATVFTASLLVILLLTGTLRRTDRGQQLVDQVERYSRKHPLARAGGEERASSAAEAWVTRLLQSGKTEQRLAERLDLAGIATKPAQWVLLAGFACVALAAVLTILTGNPPIGILAGTVVGWFSMRLMISFRIGRRRAAFAEQLPDVLQLVASSLKSGFSLSQALNAVVRENTQPTAAEFSRALAETRIGVDLGVALDQVANRMDATDLRWTVMAIRIQREVGGNLAEVLRTTVETMRERSQLRRQVRALSAEGRLSAYILLGLPVFVGGWLFLTRRSYLSPLYTTSVGLVMLIIAVVLVVVGAFWMRSLVKVEA